MADFNRIARFYDFLKHLVFANQVEKSTRYFLYLIPSNSKILIVGGGTGELLEDFQSSHKIDYVELSSVMIRKAQQVKTQSSVEFIRADILDWSSTEKFDYIITPFILDCFDETQLTSIFTKLRSILRKEGKWIQTDFYPKSMFQKLLIKVMYAFFNLTTNLKTRKLADFDLIFKKSEFKCEIKATFFHSMIESKIYQQIE